MRKITFFFLLAISLILAQPGHAQTQTNVTATITDPLGIPYANGTYSIQLIPTGTNPSVNGAAIGGAFNGRLDATGSLNVSLWPNASIVPASTTWQFTICIPGGIPVPLGTGGQCTPPTVVTISGTSQSLTATLSAVAPKLTTLASAGATISGTIASGQVAVGTALNQIGGSPDFQFFDSAGVQNLEIGGGVQGNLDLQVSATTVHILGPTQAGTDHLDIQVHGQQFFNASCSNCTTDQVLVLLPGTGAQATFTPGNLTMGADGTTAGTLNLSNAAASAHTIWGSAATTSNTILGFATAPVTGHVVTCTTVGTVCTFTDGGAAGTATVNTQVRQAIFSADGTTTTPEANGDVAVISGNVVADTITAGLGPSIGIFAGAVNTVTGISGNKNYRTGRNIKQLIVGGAGGKITDERWWFGVTDQTLATMGGSANPAGNYAAFRFDTTVADASWQAITKDGTTQNIQATGVSPAVNTSQRFAIIFNDAVPNVQFFINGVLVATATTNLPSAATVLGSVMTNECFTSTTSNGLTFGQVYVASDF